MNYNDIVGFDPGYLTTKEKYTSGGEVIELINAINKMKTNDVKRGISFIAHKLEKNSIERLSIGNKIERTIKTIVGIAQLNKRMFKKSFKGM